MEKMELKKLEAEKNLVIIVEKQINCKINEKKIWKINEVHEEKENNKKKLKNKKKKQKKT